MVGRMESGYPLVSAPRDSTPRPAGLPPGVAGALIGAGVGLAAGAVLVRALCDVPNCASHRDTKTLLVGGAVTGAVAGAAVELVWRGVRRFGRLDSESRGARQAALRSGT